MIAKPSCGFEPRGEIDIRSRRKISGIFELPQAQMVNGERDINVVRAAFAATVGNMLEFYDFITYSFFAIQIGHTFFPAQSEYGSLMLSLATFGAGFVTRPICRILPGIYSDRAGRRPAMLLSFALMGGAILLLAC